MSGLGPDTVIFVVVVVVSFRLLNTGQSPLAEYELKMGVTW